MSCMGDEVLKKVSGFDTSRKAWVKLEKSFASHLKAKMIQSKGQL